MRWPQRTYRKILLMALCVNCIVYWDVVYFIPRFRGALDEDCRCRHLSLPSSWPNSTCSPASTSRGRDQRVLSYAMYGPPTVQHDYVPLLTANLEAMRTLYPGFVLRLYHDHTGGNKSELCHVFCANHDVDLCDVTNLATLGNVSLSFGMVWRFAPMVDPLVSEWHSRDLDSVLSAREAAAVSEWRSHPARPALHVMRDNPYHRTEILGGMFGMRAGDLEETKVIWGNIQRDSESRSEKGADQLLLSAHLWPWATSSSNTSVLAHDSYTCTVFPKGLVLPWPTRRLDNEQMNFVGSNGGTLNATCPEECRPREHPEWIAC